MTIKWIGCHPNNFGSRYSNKINKIIVHWIVGTLESADATFQNPNRVASAHYGVGDNDVHQYVKEEDCAYHAGNLMVNRQSIGIEHEGGPDLPISDATYQTSAQLIKDICQRHNIPIDRDHIKGHREISATQCPGTLDIDRLISLALENTMTDDETRALDALKRYKTEFNDSSLEGTADAGAGARRDLPNVVKELEALKTSHISLEARVAELEAKLEESQKNEANWQKEAESANKTISKQNEEIETLDNERKQYKSWYEAALKKAADKLSAPELIKLLVQKLFKR